ncbi:MAG: glycoside hydrolase family 9 protein [Lachnospiraceae bacterium]|nr:glycoside hydrolase family 9 protein [Lachnospiraceae bacterium]
MKNKLYVNEIGYRPEDKKIAVYCGKEAVKYMILKDGTECVSEGVSGEGVYNSTTNDYEIKIDFSDIKECGTYVVKAGEDVSVPLTVAENVYEEVRKSLMRFFFLQRCGVELTKEYGGEYAHKICHNTPARIYGTDMFKEVNGGWHDAGDYGRYIVAAAVTLAALFHAIENDESLLKVDMQIPES